MFDMILNVGCAFIDTRNYDKHTYPSNYCIKATLLLLYNLKLRQLPTVKQVENTRFEQGNYEAVTLCDRGLPCLLFMCCVS